MTDDPAVIERLAGEIAPAVRAEVAAARGGGAVREAARPRSASRRRPTTARASPARCRGTSPTRPHRPEPPPGTTYTDRGRQAGQHLIDVHDMLRRELTNCARSSPRSGPAR